MKTLSKGLFLTVFALFLAFSGSLQAQFSKQDYQVAIGTLGEMTTLCSQIQGKANQIETLAMNGNASQLGSRIIAINDDLFELQSLSTTLLNGPILDRWIYNGLSTTIYAYQSGLMAWYTASSININPGNIIVEGGGTYPGLANAANALRRDTDYHRGQLQERRVALCCVMP